MGVGCCVAVAALSVVAFGHCGRIALQYIIGFIVIFEKRINTPNSNVELQIINELLLDFVSGYNFFVCDGL